MGKFQQLKINNSKEAAVKSGKWNAPGAAFYDRLLNSFYFEGGKVPDTAEGLQKALNNGKYIQWFQYLEEAYLVAPVKKISNSPHGVTPFSRSGCKYPHHVIRNGELVVSIPGIKAAYARALQMGVLKGDVKKHLERHIKELGLTTSFKNGALTWNENTEVDNKIEQNFRDIENFIAERTDIQFNETTPSCEMSESITEAMDWIDRFVHDDEFRESVITTFKDVCDKCKTPEELLEWMDCINYGWIDKSGKVRGTGDDEDETDFYNEYRLQAPYQLVKSKVGVCWDQTELERQWFFGLHMPNPDPDPRVNGKPRLVPFFVLYLELEDGENNPSHTTLIYKHPGDGSGNDSEVYWFEHAWYDHRGIHKYDDLKSCLNDIYDKFQDSHNDHEHHVLLRKVGLPYKWKDCKTCEEYMNLCRSGMEVDLSGPQYDDMFNEYVGIFQSGDFNQYAASDEDMMDATADIITEADENYGSSEYDPPMSYDELPEKLKKDPVHSWRAKTGIELVHREPTYEEFQRIWNNWQLMSDEMKARSDKKSMELFGVNNQTHYEQLLSEYEADLESLDNPPDGTTKKEAYVPIYGIVKSYSSLPVHNDGTPKSDSELGSVRFDKIIHKLTRGDNYSHALVSLDDSLTKMYSYEDEGFVVDNIMEKESWLGTKSIYICVMFVKKSDRDRMQKFINYLIDHKQETKYASANLLKAYVATPYKIDKRFVCSSFTGYILQCSNPKNLHRDYSRLRPEDITILPRSFYVMNVVDRNDFIEKKGQIKAKVQAIFDEFKHEIDDYNNALPKMMLKQRVDRLKRLDRIMDWIIDRM